jgi:hypothetical protein
MSGTLPEPAKRRDSRQRLLICVALAAAVLVSFEGVRHNEFVNYDDDTYVTDNPIVQKGLCPESISWAFTTWYEANWHPLTWLSHIIDCATFGVNPAWHHLVNVGFHIANVVLLFLILNKMTGGFWPSAFVAAAFGLHPLAVESVAWVAERKNVLSTLFGLLTIWAYFRYTQKAGLRRYLVVVVAFAAGLLSKPMLVTLPFVLLLLDYWPIGRIRGEPGRGQLRLAIVEKLPLLLMSAASCVVTYLAQAKSEAITDFAAWPLGLRLQNALLAYIKYIGKMFYPVSLAVLYPLNLRRPALWQMGVCFLLLALVSTLALVARHRWGYLFTGWFWYLGTLVPVIGLVQVGLQVMADRYTYWPGIGIYIIVAWLAWDAAARLKVPKGVLWAAGVPVLAVLLIMTRIQVRHWRNSLSLYEHTLAVTEYNFMIHTNYGELLRKAGRLDEAILHLKEAIKIYTGEARAYQNLGMALLDKELFAEAATAFESSLKVEPNSVVTHNYYGITLAELAHIAKDDESRRVLYDKAIEHFSEALIPGEHFSGVLLNMYNAGIKGGKLDAVLDVIKDWQLKAPDNAELYYRAGMIYGTQGNIEKAIEQLEKALDLANGQDKRKLAGQIKSLLEGYRQTKQGIE